MTMRRLGFRLERDEDDVEWPPAAMEWLWSEETDAGFRIASYPFFVKNIAFHDVIFAQLNAEDEILSWEMVSPSENSTIWIIRLKETDIIERLHHLGCGYEGITAWPKLFVLNVPPQVNMEHVLEIIDAAEAEEAIDVAYPALRREA